MDKKAFLKEIKEINPNLKLPLIEKAFDLVAIKHADQVRKSGKPYLVHLIEVAWLVATFGLDTQAVAAGLLHDVIEDYPERYSFDELRETYSKNVFEIVQRVTKKPDFDKKKPEDHKEYYTATLESPEAVLVKAGDRIHNIQSVSGLKLERQKEYVLEVEEYFFPMIKKARREYPDYYFIFIALGEILRRQIKFVKKIHELEDKILEMKGD